MKISDVTEGTVLTLRSRRHLVGIRQSGYWFPMLLTMAGMQGKAREPDSRNHRLVLCNFDGISDCYQFHYEWFEETYEDAYESYEQYTHCRDCNEQCNGIVENISTVVTTDSGDRRRICNTCKSSYSPCKDCGCVTSREYCPECSLARGYIYCEHCGDYTKSNYLTLCTPCGRTAESDRVDSCTTINEYHNCNWWKLTMSTNEERKDVPFFLGVELEADDPQDFSRRGIRNLLRQEIVADVQDDGSLDGCDSFELITHPCSFKALQEKLPDVMDIFSDVEHAGHCGEGGMHVHVSKNYFTTDEQLMRLDYFITDNCNLVEKVAKRKANTWSRYINKGDFKNYGKSQVGRYEAINFEPRNTIEFRIFAAPEDAEEAMVNVEFVTALCLWTKNLNNEYIIDGKSWKRFKKYVEKQKNKYKELHEFLKGVE